jgi:DNA-binding NarL/FixJ family response regulator
MNESPRVLIVEDHLAVRMAMELLLRKHGFRVVGATTGGEDAFQMIKKRRPDLAIIDIGLPGESGIELTRRLLADDAKVAVLLYTGSDEDVVLAEAIECGARGVALKSGRYGELLAAIRTVAAGGTYVDPRLAQLVIERSAERLGLLSKREREILDLLAEGLSGEQVASRLYLSPETIRTHIRNAMTKLDARTRTHAVALAVKRKEITL